MIIFIAIFLISATTLALEVVLVRAFSIGHWYHFSYLVISTALLGFGAGGTIVTIASKLYTQNHIKYLCYLSFGLAISIPFIFTFFQHIPLDELQLIWDWRQIVYIFVCYLLFFIPFFFAGTFIAIVFSGFANISHKLYFYNMVGSGCGAGFIVVLMYGNSPEYLLLLTSSLAFLAAIILAIKISRRLSLAILVCAVAVIFVFGKAEPFKIKIRISQNKSLSYYNALEDSKKLAARYSPLARLDCIWSSSIRHFPGLSLNYQGELPKQILIISDAEGISAINHFEDLNDPACYDYVTSAVAYKLVNQPNACIIGAGGGSDVLQAIFLKAQKVSAIEMNSQIIELMQNQFSDFSGNLYKRQDVEVFDADGRSFLQTTSQKFDIINISLLDSFSSSPTGIHALNESHLYTMESIAKVFAKLSPRGVLSITRMLKISPPRDSLKMLATIIESMRNNGVSNPEKCLIVIRSWSTMTIVASLQPFSQQQILEAKKFAQQCSFDLVYLPGIESNEVNRYHVLPEPIYYQSTLRILSDERDDFYKNYAYNIRPATDNQPYFFDFFKWKSLPYLIRAVPGKWLPYSEWGYLILVVTLIQAVVASILFILLPLWLKKPIRQIKHKKLGTLFYFLLLGLAYMFLEMSFIQKMTLMIGQPVLGMTIVLFGFLVFSGCGALTSTKLSDSAVRRIGVAVWAIIIFGAAEIILLYFFFDRMLGLSETARITLGLTIIAPLAFFMGIPFPSGLKQLNVFSKVLVPWAWGINGFASVAGAVLGTILAISLGFTTLVFIAMGCYLTALIVSKWIFS